MIKMVLLLKRREGMSFDEFVDYYENHHAVLGRKVLAEAKRYQRRFLRPVGVVPETGPTVAYDCITEAWFENQADFDAAMARAAQPANAALLMEDEAKLFDRSMIAAYLVEQERESA